MAYKKWTPKVVQRIPFNPSFAPSEFQQAIYDLWFSGSCSVHVNAVAGSGKSSSIIHAAHRNPDKRDAAYLSFNSDIVTDIKPKMPESVTVKTAHAFGLKAVMSHFRCPNLVDSGGKNKIMTFLREYDYISDKNDPNAYERMKACNELIDKMRLNLIDPSNRDGINAVIDTYNIEIDVIDRFVRDIPDIYDKTLETAKKGLMDFVDMLWVPVYMDLKIEQFPVMYIDECQDFSSLMQKFAYMMASGKVMTVGDRFQSIYGFAGADTQAVDRIVKTFNSTELPLSVCYRCPRVAIEQAQRIVPHILPRDNAPEGELRVYGDEIEWSIIPRDNTMVLCRRNAPLVRPVFKLLKDGVKATIKGKDVGKGLIKLVDTLGGDKCPNMSVFLDKLEEYRLAKIQVIMNRKNPNANAVEAVNDNCEALEAFCEGRPDTMSVKMGIKQVFDQKGGVVFSTVHKSKGLEEDNVFILDRTNIRMKGANQTPEEAQQEANLEYVALTRCKKILGYIG